LYSIGRAREGGCSLTGEYCVGLADSLVVAKTSELAKGAALSNGLILLACNPAVQPYELHAKA
jgi:hypothetical protein